MVDLGRPFPDRGKEALRLLANQTRADADWNASSVDVSFDLTDTLFDLAASVLDAVTGLQDARNEVQSLLADLTARVTALEPTPAPTDPTIPEA